ncbi:MAG: hypothetical protein U9O90_01395 [Euryarchaeota archaeon]|nr:hypothetical protein [Euryarchaeota archaeon]
MITIKDMGIMQSLSTPNWDVLGNSSKIQEARNDEDIGTSTSTYQNGEPGKTYNPCDEIIVTYFKKGNESIETSIKSFIIRI